MPEDPDEDPERYAQCMRLLWLAASMKAFDVVVLLLPTEEANAAMCELISDMVPMLQFTRKRDPQPPQVVVALPTDTARSLASQHLSPLAHLVPEPLVITRGSALSSLVCEVLHPAAHWSGSLESEHKAEDDDDDDDDDARAAGFGGGGGSGSAPVLQAAPPLERPKAASPTPPRKTVSPKPPKPPAPGHRRVPTAESASEAFQGLGRRLSSSGLPSPRGTRGRRDSDVGEEPSALRRLSSSSDDFQQRSLNHALKDLM